MLTRNFSRLGMALLVAGSICGAATAGTEVVVMSDQAKVVSLTGQAGTVVVGNPNIADVTVQGNQIFVHGRNYGSTNMIVLDREGKQIASLDVTVMLGGNSNVSVFRAGGRYSYVCSPSCEATLQVGDKVEFFDAIGKANAQKVDLATGAASKDSE